MFMVISVCFFLQCWELVAGVRVESQVIDVESFCLTVLMTLVFFNYVLSLFNIHC